jgi:hypothetical protein
MSKKIGQYRLAVKNTFFKRGQFLKSSVKQPELDCKFELQINYITKVSNKRNSDIYHHPKSISSSLGQFCDRVFNPLQNDRARHKSRHRKFLWNTYLHTFACIYWSLTCSESQVQEQPHQSRWFWSTNPNSILLAGCTTCIQKKIAYNLLLVEVLTEW